jgi:hypothetical protein
VACRAVTDLRPVTAASVRGFIKVSIGDTCTIDGFKLMETNGNRWLAVPSRSYKKRDGSTAYADLVEFASVQAKRLFEGTVLDAVAAIELVMKENGL